MTRVHRAFLTAKLEGAKAAALAMGGLGLGFGFHRRTEEWMGRRDRAWLSKEGCGLRVGFGGRLWLAMGQPSSAANFF